MTEWHNYVYFNDAYIYIDFPSSINTYPAIFYPQDAKLKKFNLYPLESKWMKITHICLI